MELYEIVNRYHIGTDYSCAESILLGCEEYYHLNLPEQGDGYAYAQASRLRLLRNNLRRKWDFESLQ